MSQKLASPLTFKGPGTNRFLFILVVFGLLSLQILPASAANNQNQPHILSLNLGSFLASDLVDSIDSMALDNAGAVYVAGKTSSLAFPLVNPFQSTYAGGDSDGFITVFAPDGQTLLVSTYFGGNGTDEITGIEISNSGRVYLTGSTSSTNLPLLNAYQPAFGGAVDGFVTVFNPHLESLSFSTYFGGPGVERIDDLAIGPEETAHIIGNTYSNNFPVLNPFQGYQGGQDLILTGFSADGQSLLYSTYLGGTDDEQAYEIVLDPNGRKYITGYTKSTDFPVANAFQPTHYGGSWDGFVTVLSPDSQSLDTSTFIGGSLSDRPYTIQIDGSGRIYIGGGTQSADFPLQNPYQPLKNTGWDGFLTIFNPGGQSLAYSTFLGGNAAESIHSLSINHNGRIHATGDTYSTNFPLANPFQPNNNGSLDTFLTTFEVDGQSLVNSTYLGGDGSEIGQSIHLGENGLTYIAGVTWSSNFPLMNPFQPNITGYLDGFVTIFNADGQSLHYSTYLGGSYPAPTSVSLNELSTSTPARSALPAWLWLLAGLTIFFFASLFFEKLLGIRNK